MTYEEADADALRMLNEIEEKGEKLRYFYRKGGSRTIVGIDLQKYYVAVVAREDTSENIIRKRARASYAITIPEVKLIDMVSMDEKIKHATYELRRIMRLANR